MELGPGHRYTAALALVSIWDDRTQYGDVVDVDITAQDVKDILSDFKPIKDVGDQMLEIHVRGSSLTLTDASGMFTVDPKQLRLPTREPAKFPDVQRLMSAAIRAARRAGDVIDQSVLWSSPTAYRKFTIAGEQYGTLEQYVTQEARTARLYKAGESFLGLMMPITPDQEAMTASDGHLVAWLRRLPEPAETPVEMPADEPVDLSDVDAPDSEGSPV